MFFTRNNTEWLLAGKTYSAQCFIDLDNKIIYEKNRYDTSDNFSWTDEVVFNPSGTMVCVNGCYWGASFEYLIYDISSLEKGWDIVPTTGTNDDFTFHHSCYSNEAEWLDDITLEFISYRTKQDFLDDIDAFVLSDDDLLYFNNLDDNEYYIAYKLLLEKQDNKMVCTKIHKGHEYQKFLRLKAAQDKIIR